MSEKAQVQVAGKIHNERAVQAFKRAFHAANANGDSYDVAVQAGLDAANAASPAPSSVQEGQGGLTEVEIDRASLDTCTAAEVIGGTMCHVFTRDDRQKFGRAIESAILARQTAPTVGSVPQAGAVALVPKWAGEFATIEEWVDRAQEVLSANGRGPAICVDAKGRRCAIGRDFSRARDENAFPVRYFWECELAQASRAAVLEGWKLVPVIPTERMLAAAACTSGDDWTPGTTGGNSEGNSYRRHIAQKEYAAMLAAAPAAQEGGAVDAWVPRGWHRADRPWHSYPLGTKARESWSAGFWLKTERGWKWHLGATFPTPGGADEVLYPTQQTSAQVDAPEGGDCLNKPINATVAALARKEG